MTDTLAVRPGKRLGFFSRLLDAAPPAERYRLGAEQIAHAERHGFDGAWIAQHHFHEDEGGMPAPLVFLGYVAARTSRIRLGTGIVTLAARAAGARGRGCRGARRPGGRAAWSSASGRAGRLRPSRPSARTAAERGPVLRPPSRGAAVTALAGGTRWRATTTGSIPPRPSLADRLWQATFSVDGGRRAGAGGGRAAAVPHAAAPAGGARNATLDAIQNPIVDAYLAALPPGRAPRIVGSRSVFVAERREEARRLAELGLRRAVGALRRRSGTPPPGRHARRDDRGLRRARGRARGGDRVAARRLAR